jgi:hypothetical protein
LRAGDVLIVGREARTRRALDIAMEQVVAALSHRIHLSGRGRPIRVMAVSGASRRVASHVG